MTRLPLALMLGLTLTTSSCASLFASGPSQVHLTVDHPAATTAVVRDDGRTQATLTGPTHTLTLDKGHDYVFRVTGENGVQQDVKVGRQVTPAFWANLILLGLGLANLVPGLTAVDNSGLSRGLTIGLLLPIVLVGSGGAMGVDALNGSMWEHTPQTVHIGS
jgi:hypothetical protein